MIALGLLIPFQTETPLSFQLKEWLVEILTGLIFPLVMWNVLLYEKNAVTVFIKSFVVIILISCIYGLLLTLTKGINPYIMFINLLDGKEFAEGWFAADDRLFGRISSTFEHPMRWALFLGLALIFFAGIKNNMNKWLQLIIIFLIGANIIVCGVRSVIVSLIITAVFYLLRKRQIKLLLGAVACCFIVLLIIHLNEDLYNYFYSIIDFSAKKTSVQGSSLDMRINQLEGAFAEIRTSPLVGKGYGWWTYYLAKNGMHPILLAFESLIFMVLCQSGFLGCIIWTVFFLLSFYIPKIYLKSRDEIILVQCLTVFYMVYCVLTGDYAYMRLYYIFYVLMIGMYYNFFKNKKILAKLILFKILTQNNGDKRK
jgi:hypothetical protein